VSRAKPAYASIHKSDNVAITTARERRDNRLFAHFLSSDTARAVRRAQTT